MTAAVHSAGFADPVREAQRVFRALLEALARPGSAQAVEAVLAPPAPLGPVMAAVALALCDEATPLHLDETLAATPEAGAWLAFHTGAPLVAERARAAFAFVATPSAIGPLAAYAQGSDEAPHSSTTLVVDVSAATTGQGAVVAAGPGILGERQLVLPWADEAFLADWARNHAAFPRGVDLLLAGEGFVVGLPRTTALVAAEGGR